MIKDFLIAAFAAAAVQPIWSLATGLWSFVCYMLTVALFWTIVVYVDEWIQKWCQK